MSKRYRIETPDGKTIEVEGPEDATDDELIDFARSQIDPKFKSNPVINKDRPRTMAGIAMQQGEAKANLPSMVTQGLTFGLSDELAGAAGVVADAIAAPFSDRIDFNPAQSYRDWRDQERATIAATRAKYPWLAPGLELGAGLATGGGVARGAFQGAGVSAGQGVGGLLSTAGQGARAAVLPGAVSGFGYGEGTNGSLAGAGVGAGLGAAVGAALPIAYSAVSRPVTTAINYMRPQPGIGRSLVAKALREDGITPSMAGERIAAAQSRGVPLAMADLGENLRGLTGAVSRAPGPSRRLVRQALTTRQAEQGERVRGAIERDLGPIGNITDASEQLTQRANAAAAPLYDQARAAPVISTPEMEAILSTPAGRRALAEARTIAMNERRDPEALGFALDADGNVVLNPTLNLDDAGNIVQDAAQQRGYTLDTIDLVKRGLDAILEPNRNPVTRRLDLSGNPLAQSQNTVRQQLIAEADRLNPAYAQARAAFAEPSRQRTALEQGGKMTNATAEEVERATRGLTDAERAQYALGYRSQLAENLERRVTAGDKVGAMIGTPRKQRALGQLFGDGPGFDRFASTLNDETLANETFRSVMTGSPTANRLADDAAITDQSIVEDMAGKALKGAANGGLAGFFAEGINIARDLNRFGAGATGNRARDEAASLLMEVNPLLLRESLAEGLRQSAARRVAERAARRKVRQGGIFGARLSGGIGGYALRPNDQ